MKVKVIENPNARPKQSRKGKFVGYCPHCGLMLADFDKVKVKYRCARCDKLTANPADSFEHKKSSRPIEELFTNSDKKERI